MHCGTIEFYSSFFIWNSCLLPVLPGFFILLLLPVPVAAALQKQRGDQHGSQREKDGEKDSFGAAAGGRCIRGGFIGAARSATAVRRAAGIFVLRREARARDRLSAGSVLSRSAALIF